MIRPLPNDANLARKGQTTLDSSQHNLTTYNTTSPPKNEGVLSSYDAGLVGIAGFQSAKVENSTERKFRLQNVVRGLLPSKHKTTRCMRWRLPEEKVQIVKNDDGHIHYKNVEVCDRYWVCPVCAPKIAERRRQQMQHAIATSGYHPALLTLTLRHHRKQSLQETKTALRKAYHRMCQAREYKKLKAEYGYKYQITDLEPTYSDKNGWHPHLHIVPLFERKLTDAQVRAFEHQLKLMWPKYLQKEGFSASYERGVDMRNGDAAVYDYISKHGREPKNMGWDITKEATLHTVKKGRKDSLTPFEILDLYASTGDDKWANLFKEYAEAMKGTAQIYISRGLKQEVNFDEIAEKLQEEYEQDNHLYIQLTNKQWRAIKYFQARGKLLKACKNRPKRIVNRWVIMMEKEYYRRHIDIGKLEKEEADRIAWRARWEYRPKLDIHYWQCRKCGYGTIKQPHLYEICKCGNNKTSR